MYDCMIYIYIYINVILLYVYPNSAKKLYKLNDINCNARKMLNERELTLLQYRD